MLRRILQSLVESNRDRSNAVGRIAAARDLHTRAGRPNGWGVSQRTIAEKGSRLQELVSHAAVG